MGAMGGKWSRCANSASQPDSSGSPPESLSDVSTAAVPQLGRARSSYRDLDAGAAECVTRDRETLV